MEFSSFMEHDYQGLEIIARAYGFMGSVSCHHEVTRVCIGNDLDESFLKFVNDGGQGVYLCPTEITLAETRIEVSRKKGGFLYRQCENRPRIPFLAKRRRPLYVPVGEYFAFPNNSGTKILVTEDGQAVILGLNYGKGKILLIGLDILEEIVRYRQGDPREAEIANKRSKYGFDFERPNYLFERQLLPGYETEPWADNLGFFWAETLSRLTGLPLVEPFPTGARGLVLITGDDDQAYLEKYGAQLKLLDGIPITYFLLPHTRHTRETIARMPKSVEFGIHVDALDTPWQYDAICSEQCRQVRNLVGRPLRSLRNHGFLNSGYLGHLKAWEEAGVMLDLNYPGTDGSALNGSFLPMRVRRSDGSWSKHLSLLTAFGDGMVFALGMSEREAARKIRGLVKQIEANHPGVLVLNVHPQNIDKTKRIHRQAIRIAQRSGWVALGLESYLDWLETLDSICVKKTANGCVLTSPRQVSKVALRVPTRDGWGEMRLDSWTGNVGISFD